MQSYALNVIFSAAPVLRSTVLDRTINLVKTTPQLYFGQEIFTQNRGFIKAIYIRLDDWSFLNGDNTNFVEVFQH